MSKKPPPKPEKQAASCCCAPKAHQPETPQDKPQDDWKEKALRLAADMENLRKRTTREKQEAQQFAVTSFARELLTVADNMERALTAIDQQAENPATLKEGIAMVAHQLDQVFSKFHIQKFVSKGQPLDPNKHQVMTQMPSDQPAGTIVEEMQPGYTIGERLLRPALVGVAQAKEQSQKEGEQ